MPDDTSLVFYGLADHIGETRTAFIAGLDCGDYVVDNFGGVTVPFGSDPDGSFTPSFVITNSGDTSPRAVTVTFTYLGSPVTVTIPVVIGFTYTSEGQTLRPATEADIKSPQGSGLAKMRRSAQVGVLFDQVVRVNLGTTFDTLDEVDFRDPRGDVVGFNQMFSGVYWDTLKDNYSFEGGVAWQVLRPYPCAVMSVTGFLKTQDR